MIQEKKKTEMLQSSSFKIFFSLNVTDLRLSWPKMNFTHMETESDAYSGATVV